MLATKVSEIAGGQNEFVRCLSDSLGVLDHTSQKVAPRSKQGHDRRQHHAVGLGDSEKPGQGLVSVFEGIGKGSSECHHGIEGVVKDARRVAYVEQLSRFHRFLCRGVRDVNAIEVKLDRGDVGHSYGSAEVSQFQREAPRAGTNFENP